MKGLILFLIRKKLNVRKYEGFKFLNQRPKSNDIYYFDNDRLMKFANGMTMPSRVSLNWLVSKECKIEGDLGDFSCL